MVSIIYNSFWIMLEKLCFAGAGIISAMYVARYLGPENFGSMSYLISIIALITPFILLGSDNVLFNRLAKNPGSGLRLLHASLRLKMVLFFIFSAALLLWEGLRLTPDRLAILAILLAGAFFSLADIYKVFYDAMLASKINLIINNTALVIFVLMNVAFVHYQLGLKWFAAAIALRSFIPFIARRILFAKKSSGQFIQKIKPSLRQLKKYNFYLMRVGCPLAISSLAIVIYTRIDQILLAKFLGFKAVGFYSAALTISQGWILVPMAFITSYMTVVAAQRDPQQLNERMRTLYLITLLISAPVILIMGLFSQQIITLVYGAAYNEAASILLYCALTSLCSVLGTISYRAIILHAGYRFVAIKMPVVALLNVALNYHFIPLYGLKGAALSTLFSEASSLIVLNALFKKGLVTQQMFCAYKNVPIFISEVRNHVTSTRQTSN